MTWSAILNSASWANACPVLGFRSHMGKLLLVIGIERFPLDCQHGIEVIYLSCGRLRRLRQAKIPAKWLPTGFEIKTRRVSVSQNKRPGTSRSRALRSGAVRPGLDWLHVLCLEPLGPLRHVEADLLAFRESAKTLRADGRVVAEDVLAAIVLRDEPEALRIIEPLHCTGCHALLSQSQAVNPPGLAHLARKGRCTRLLQGRQADNEGRPRVRLVLAAPPESENREVDGVGHRPIPEGVRVIAVVHPVSAHPGRNVGILHQSVPVDTASQLPRVRMKAFTSSRFCSFELPTGLHMGSTVEQTMRSPRARTRMTISSMPLMTCAAGDGGQAPSPPRSFVPSSSITSVTPGTLSTSRSSRTGAGAPQHC